MDVPKGPLRQDAELGRSRCESEVLSETTNTTARSRWEGKRREEAFLPGAKTNFEFKLGRQKYPHSCWPVAPSVPQPYKCPSGNAVLSITFLITNDDCTPVTPSIRVSVPSRNC